MDLTQGNFLIIFRIGFIAQSHKDSFEKIDFHTNKADNYIGDSIEGKDIIIIDDIISTGSTICSLAEYLKEKGASRVFSFIYHDIMNEKAINILEKSKLDELLLLNTRYEKTIFNEKIVKLNVAKILSNYLDELVLKCNI